MDSPRGRIFIIKSLAEGRMSLSDSTVRHLSLCLDCRACETVCPAGVPYGHLIEAAKAEIERERPGALERRLFAGSTSALARTSASARLAPRRALLSGERAAASGPQVGLVRLLPGPCRRGGAPAAGAGKEERTAPPAVTRAEGPAAPASRC
jgi:glycolate oxidase iron-sulfur subunit